MATHAAFLRGMNVGAHHRVSNADLQRMFSALGFGAVGTFRASGNVAFTAGRQPLERLTVRIEGALAQELGFAVPTFLRTAKEMRAICAFEPFEKRLVEVAGGKLQVSILADRPSAKVSRQVLAMASERDRLAFGVRELYWLPSGGILETELDLAAIESALGATTRRTKGTIEQMAAKYFPG
ncbi:MAG: hypothetical protein JWO23_2461 [Solirubrobacterales bacterium]|jgi:uncharacterized protein (DUF1697 family)|nr:hypothetical protein [Solirubrobacterales bacterium]